MLPSRTIVFIKAVQRVALQFLRINIFGAKMEGGWPLFKFFSDTNILRGYLENDLQKTCDHENAIFPSRFLS